VFYSKACYIETLAWTFDTPNDPARIGYITVNSIVWPRTAAITSYTARGFNTVKIDVSDCSIHDFHNFDTHRDTSYSNALVAYISGLSPTTVLIGVTADEAANLLTQAARDTLLSIGVNVTQLQYRDKAAFIAQIGRPSAAVMNTTKQFGSNIRLNAVVSRTYIRVNCLLCTDGRHRASK
jgi:hypothetical protein